MPQDTPPTSDLLLQQLQDMSNSDNTCQAITTKVFRQLGDELVEKRAKLLFIALQAYGSWLKDYAKEDRPNSVFYTKSSTGEFVANNTYSEALASRLTRWQDEINKLKTAIDACLAVTSTGNNYESLAATMKELSIPTN